MREAEGVPEDHIRVVEFALRIGCDPGWDTLRRFARGLRHVAAGGVDLVVGVCNMSGPAIARRYGMVETYTW